MAFSCWDCKRRSATRARRRLMGTRCSGRPSSDTSEGAGAAALEVEVFACRASPLVIRPPGPEPVTFAGSTPFSDRILVAAGDAKTLLITAAPEAYAERECDSVLRAMSAHTTC